MKQENWEEAIITFTDILKYRYSCDLSQFPKDDENIKEKLSEDELEHLKKAEYSFYDAYVSLIECYFKQNMIHDAEDSSCDLYKLLNGIYEMKESELTYAYNLFKQICITIDTLNLNNKLYLKMHNDLVYTKIDNEHIINNLYKDEVSILKSKKDCTILRKINWL